MRTVSKEPTYMRALVWVTALVGCVAFWAAIAGIAIESVAQVSMWIARQ